MRKWILVTCLGLAFVFGLALTAQAKEIASFSSDNSGQIELAVLREGPKGGWPVLVDDHLRVTGYLNIDTGVIVREKPGGNPVIIGDHLRVDGWLFANSGIVNVAPGGSPVIIADHLRVEGEISRAAGPVKIKDDLQVTGNLKVSGTFSAARLDKLIGGQVKTSAIKTAAKSTTWKGYVYEVQPNALSKYNITVTFTPTSPTTGTFSSTPINFMFPLEKTYWGQTFTGNYRIVGNTILAWNVSPTDTGRGTVATMSIFGTTIMYTNHETIPPAVVELEMQ